MESRKRAARGALHRVGRGVDRMLETPYDPLGELAEGVALGGTGAARADESVLAHIHLRRIGVGASVEGAGNSGVGRRYPVQVTRPPAAGDEV